MNTDHESPEMRAGNTTDPERALHSLKEEIEAIAWYQQRLENSSNAQLKRILTHNRNEEIEHVCMLLEWLRRNMEGWEPFLRSCLFSKGEITSIETT